VGFAFSPERLLARAGSGAWTRIPLPEGFLSPSPETANLRSTADTARILEEALAALAPDSGPFRQAVIAIPDRSAHIRRLEGPRSLASRRLGDELFQELVPGGRRDGRYRFDWVATRSGGRRSLLGAASRAAVIRQYERAVEAVGLAVRWVDAESLAVLPEWLGASSGPRALVLLHSRHFVLLNARGAHLEDFRFKLRGALDPVPVARAVSQSAPAAIQVWGEGASALAEVLRKEGRTVSEARETASGEPPLIAGRALEALLRRARFHPAKVAREAA